MAVSRAELEVMDRDELGDTILELRDRLDEIEVKGTEDFATAAQDRARIRSSLNDIEDGLQEELHREGDRQARERSQLTRRVANLEDELGIEDQDIVALATKRDDLRTRSCSPLGQ